MNSSAILTSEFVRAANPDGNILYHGKRRLPENGMIMPQAGVTVADEKGNFVFATPLFYYAACYTIRNPSVLMIGHTEEKHDLVPAVLVDGRDEYLRQEFSGRVYSLSKNHFRNVIWQHHKSTEWVSEAPVPVNGDEGIAIGGVENLMNAGVQFFFLKPQFSREGFFLSMGRYLEIRDLFTHDMLTWENRDRGISMPAFAF